MAILYLYQVKLKQEILAEIKRRVKEAEPGAEIFLYGSYARDDANSDSDIDLLILVDRDTINSKEKIGITDPLYSLGFETGYIFSPLVQTKNNWEAKYSFTPLYNSIKKEGKEI